MVLGVFRLFPRKGSFQDFNNANYTSAVATLDFGRPAPSFIGYAGWTSNVVLPEFQKVLVGDATVEEAVDAMIKGLEDELG